MATSPTVTVRGVACLITWPMRKSSKKLPAPVFDIVLTTIFDPKLGGGRARRAVFDVPSRPSETKTAPPMGICYTLRDGKSQGRTELMSIEVTHDPALMPAEPARPVIHPRWVRVTHWVNALAMVVLIGSGWQIYNASPLFAFVFPPGITLGGWLAGALLWHFAAMWLLAVNGLIYVVLGIVTGRFRRKLLPIRPREVLGDARAAFTGKLSYDDLSVYNAVQRLFYLGVIVAGIVVVL